MAGQMKGLLGLPVEVILESVEIMDGVLVWKDRPMDHYPNARAAYLSKIRAKPGSKVNLHSKFTNKGSKKKASYVLFQYKGKSYRPTVLQVAYALHNNNWPEKHVWLVDGNDLNLSKENISIEFHSWWDREGVEQPGFKKRIEK